MISLSKTILRTIIIILAMALVLLVAAQKINGGAWIKINNSDFAQYGELANFSLVDSRGHTITKGDLLGSKWLINFIFTRCPSMCPTMSLQFQLLGKTLPKGVGLLSISVDPEYDTAEKLAAYSSRYKTGVPVEWLFLTGNKGEVNQFIKSCHIGTDEDPNMHSLRFILIDDKAQIRGYYDSTDPGVIPKIKEDIKKLHG